jgi:hypothetical protein
MLPRLEHSGPIYNCVFSATVLSSGQQNQDLFVLTAPSDSRVAIREIRLGQYTEFGDAQSELFGLLMLTGSTSGGGGATLTPRNVAAYTGAKTAGSSVTGPSTTLASTTSAVVSLADSWNVSAGWYHKPDFEERVILGLNQRFVLRLVGGSSANPNDPLTLNGTMIIQELGRGIPA